MRSFAERARVVVIGVALVIGALAAGPLAQEAPASRLFEEARAMETALRKDIGAYKPGTPSLPLVRRARILVGTYEDIARLFPDSGFGDRAYWQGAALAADVFGVFREATDRETAARLLDTLSTRFPSSPLVAQATARSRTLGAQSPATSAPAATAPPVAARVAQPQPQPRVQAPATVTAQAPAPAAPQGPTLITAIRREALADVLRVTIELDRETAFRDERIDGPARVFVDLQNTRASSTVQDGRFAFDDDVVRQIRVGRQLDRRTRVVMDLSDAPRHSVYTLYNPFRVVIDFERPRTDAAVAPPTSSELPGAPRALLRAAITAKPPVVAPRRQEAVISADTNAVIAARPAPALPAPAREPVISALPPLAKNPSGLSISRQLGLGISRIVIDPGHGGQDPGARQNGVSEAELVLDVALRLEQILLKSGAVDVVLTRRSNVYIPLEDRPALAMREQADLYLSIHANASEDRQARGVETYILNFAQNVRAEAVAARENRGSARTMRNLPEIVRAITLNNKIDESRALARQVQDALVSGLRQGNRTIRNLGVKQAPFAVLVGADMPSVLAEIAFISNPQEGALVKTASYRQQIAQALANGIMRYQRRLKPERVTAGSTTP